MADAHDITAMRRALDLARRGAGRVEPNPQVGAVIARRDATGGLEIIAEGWHEIFGGPHAEIVALRAAGERARGGTLYVTLEPCCHHGKTPPCTDAIIAAGISRVVVGARDPFPAVSGGGIAGLERAGIAVEVGIAEEEAVRLTAAFRMLVERGRPWVIAKWAMSLDGALATGTPEDRWLSSAESRAIVHDLRGRIDGILVGIGTVLADDPLLTARPPGPRTPLRIVVDSTARLPVTSRLAGTAREIPTLVAVGPEAPADRIAALRATGCEVWQDDHADKAARLHGLLHELGRRRHTTLLVEGGPAVLRGFFAAELVDEVWAFIAPRIVGTAAASLPSLDDAPPVDVEHVDHPGGDIFIRGVVKPGLTSRRG